MPKLRVLVICERIANTASGLVIENLLKYLDNHENITLSVVANRSYSEYPFNDLVEINQADQIINIKYKLSLILTGKEPRSKKWVSKGINAVAHKSFDVVLGLTSAYSFRAFQLAHKLSINKNIPLALHAFDPMPSVPTWGEHPVLRQIILKSIKPYYKAASLISASNQTMIEYQLKELKLKNKKHTFLYNPISIKVYDEKYTTNTLIGKEQINLLYLGTLYEKRSPANLLSAIQKLNGMGYNFKVSFVGNINSAKILESIKTFSFATIYPFQSNSNSIISKHDVLIDIDANINNDVFMSSKLSNYISINKPILCITNFNSPTYNMVKDCKNTINTAENNVDSIIFSLSNLINNAKFDYNERNNIINEFSLENVGDKLIKALYQISK